MNMQNQDCNCKFKNRYPPKYDQLICSKCGKKWNDNGTEYKE